MRKSVSKIERQSLWSSSHKSPYSEKRHTAYISNSLSNSFISDSFFFGAVKSEQSRLTDIFVYVHGVRIAAYARMKHRKPTNILMAPVKTTVLLLTLSPKYMRMTPNKTRNIPTE
jgi:hypothetical protein